MLFSRSRSETRKDVCPLRHEEVAVAQVVHPRVRRESTAAQLAVVSEPGLGVVRVRAGLEAWVRLEGIGGPFPDAGAPMERHAEQRRGMLPLRRARQSSARPRAIGFGFEGI